MDVNNANTLSLMRHRIKPQNASMGYVFQRLFFSRFMPIPNQCFVAKHTFVQKGDYCDMFSFVIVSIMALGHRPYLLLNQYRCLKQYNIRTLNTFA